MAHHFTLHLTDPVLDAQPEVREWLDRCAEVLAPEVEQTMADFMAFGSIIIRRPSESCP